jgi:WD40 repeat protein
MMNTIKTIFTVWFKGTGAIFGVLIVGFIGFMLFKSVIQPRFAAQTTCLTAPNCLYTAVNGSNSVRVIGFSPDGTRLLTRAGGGGTQIHDAANGDRIEKLDPTFEQFSTEFTGATPEIAAIGKDSIEFFDLDGELLRTWQADPDESAQDFAALPLVEGFALAQADGINFYRMSDGTQFTQLPKSAGMSNITASADGAYLAAWHPENESLHVWPLENIDKAITINEIDDADSLQLNADGSLLAAFNEAGAFVWNTATGDLVGSVQNPEFTVNSISLSADGSHLAVGYADGFVEVWSVAEGALVQLFEHPQKLFGISLSPDGSQLAVGLQDDAIVTRITSQERWLAQQNANRGYATNGDQFLTPNTTYIDTKPGFAIVWAVSQ